MTHNTLDVWLDNSYAGKLMRDPQGQVEFAYDAEYLAGRPTPLSVSIPTSEQAHGPQTVMPWLSNLLPDAEEVRDRWAAKFDERSNDPFTLLRHMGQDAPGSVQVLPERMEPSQSGSYAPISRTRIAERVMEIIHDPDHWVDDDAEDQSRFSLGGNQGKFALALIDGAWFEPNGSTPSTHIVKPGMTTTGRITNTEAQAAEFVTMRTARTLRIPSAQVRIEDFDGLPTFVTQRYDRVKNADQTITRVHQEDFCQALSLYPSRKYEQDGGPTMADMAGVVDEHTSLRWKQDSRLMLAQLFAFNLLVAGVDAHAKNHSLLISRDAVRLAPAYDLISAHGLWEPDRVTYKSSAAVKYGRARRFQNIDGRNIARAADAIGMPRSAFSEQLREMSTGLRSALESAVSELPPQLLTERIRLMPKRAADFASTMLARLDADLTAVAPFAAPRSPRQGPRTGNVWVAGRYRAGHWELGHYRTRPVR